MSGLWLMSNFKHRGVFALCYATKALNGLGVALLELYILIYRSGRVAFSVKFKLMIVRCDT